MDSAPTSPSESARDALTTEITRTVIRHRTGSSLANLLRFDSDSPKRA